MKKGFRPVREGFRHVWRRALGLCGFRPVWRRALGLCGEGL